MNESRRARKFEVVKSHEVEGEPKFEVRIYGEYELREGLINPSQVAENYLEDVQMAVDESSGEQSYDLDFFLPGKVARSMGMPEGLDHGERTGFKKDFINSLQYDFVDGNSEMGEQRVLRVIEERIDFIREHAERVQGRLNKYKGVVEDAVMNFFKFRSGQDEEFMAVLDKRMSSIKKLTVVDPLLVAESFHHGVFDSEEREIEVNVFAEEPLAIYAHELLHLLQAEHMLKEVDDEFGFNLYPDIEHVRTGVDIDRGEVMVNNDGNKVAGRYFLKGINEAMTETVNRVVGRDIAARVPDWKGEKDSYYLQERDIFGRLIDFIEDNVGSDDALEIESLFYRAAFLDDVNSEKGRAFYFRKLSKKMRELFGDGALVAIDNEMDRLLTELKEVDPESVDDTLESFKNFLASRLRK